MDEVKQLQDILETQGTDRAIVFIFLGIVTFVFVVFVKRYLKGLDEQQEINKENNKNYIDMITKMTEAITRNTDDIGDFKMGLSEHTRISNDNFRQVNSRFDALEKKVDIIEDKADNIATKTMIIEIKEDLKDLRDSLKKD